MKKTSIVLMDMGFTSAHTASKTNIQGTQESNKPCRELDFQFLLSPAAPTKLSLLHGVWYLVFGETAQTDGCSICSI